MTDLRALEAERLQQLRDWMETSPRSQQTELGWSEAGHSCRRYVWETLNNTPAVNRGQHVLAALRGIGVHTELEPFLESLGYATEQAVEYGGIPGHVDAFRDGVVEDTKSALASKVRALRLYGPTKAWRTQVQGYARALAEKGHTVHTVRIVAYAIDSSDEIAIWQEPYDPAVADEAVADVMELAAQTEPPRAGMDVSWCEKFCKFYDVTGEVGCPSRLDDDDLPGIDDPAQRLAVADLRRARAELNAAKDRKAAAEEALRGVFGVADGYVVSQTRVPPLDVPDDEKVRALYLALEGELPTKPKAGYSYVSVRKVHR